jgi:hypothetical protein
MFAAILRIEPTGDGINFREPPHHPEEAGLIKLILYPP